MTLKDVTPSVKQTQEIANEKPYEAWAEVWARLCYSTPASQAVPSHVNDGVQLLGRPRIGISLSLYGLDLDRLASAGWEHTGSSIYLRQNEGNTCFVNALLQALLRIRGFCLIVDAHAASCSRSPHCVLCALAAESEAHHGRENKSLRSFHKLLRGGALGSDFLGIRECDAEDLFYQIRLAYLSAEIEHAMNLAVCGSFSDLQLLRSQSVLSEAVWGTVIRTRIMCKECGYASDNLSIEDRLRLQLPHDQSACSLESLLLQFSTSDNDANLKCPISCVPCSRAERQYFIEKEPNILVLTLVRGQRRGNSHVRLNNSVEFPEVLTCMRSGDYHFAAVVRHRGKRTDGGHYLTTCWIGGDRYSEINCLPVGHQREID